MKFKVGDEVKAPGWSKSYKVSAVSDKVIQITTGKELPSYPRDWAEQHFTLVEKPKPAIDWKKPIQLSDGDPVTYVGVRPDGKHVVAVSSASTGYYVISVEPDGTAAYARTSIVNVPPPPVWPQKRWFVVGMKGPATTQISGQKRTKKEADDMAARYPGSWVQEVTFNGPSGT